MAETFLRRLPPEELNAMLRRQLENIPDPLAFDLPPDFIPSLGFAQQLRQDLEQRSDSPEKRFWLDGVDGLMSVALITNFCKASIRDRLSAYYDGGVNFRAHPEQFLKGGYYALILGIGTLGRPGGIFDRRSAPFREQDLLNREYGLHFQGADTVKAMVPALSFIKNGDYASFQLKPWIDDYTVLHKRYPMFSVN